MGLGSLFGFGGGGGGKPPKPPDPYAVADAQTRTNQQTALFNAALNRTNTYTPFGSQTFTQTGTDASGAPTYRTDVNLSPEQQALYQQQSRQNLQLGDYADDMMGQFDVYGQPLDLSSLPSRGTVNADGLPDVPGAEDLGGFRKQAQDAIYNRNTEYMDRQFEREGEALRTRLANQGIAEGSEAWRNAMEDENRRKEISYRQARNEAIAGGGEEAERMFGIGSATRGQLYGERLTGGEFANRSRAQALGESLTERSQPLAEFSALRTASPVQMPQFAPPANVAMNPTDLAGNVYRSYQGDLDIWNASQAGQNAALGGLFNLGGNLGSALIMRSDRRLKRDIQRVGQLDNGLPLYRFRYLEGDTFHIGVMADEVAEVMPEAVGERHGFATVNYAMLGVPELGAGLV